jgi:serine/threonine protein kinase
MASLDNCSTTTKYTSLGRPKKVALTPKLWKVGELVKPMKVPANLVGNTIYLGDFGLSIKAGTSVTQKVQSPASFCAPERFHDSNPSFATDMWSYMCLFLKFYTECSPFYGTGTLSLISWMVDTLGPLPAHWNGNYKAGGTSDDSWYDQTREPHPDMALEVKIPKWRPDASPEELQLVLSIIRRGLSYLPENRPTAAQLLEDPSFVSLMEIYQV